MRKIVITGVAAALALGLTACDNDGTSAAPAGSTPAPSDTSTPSSSTSPSASASPSTPSDSGGSESPTVRRPAGQQVTSQWGRLRYLAPGKFTVGGVVFFTAESTVVIVAGGQCPDGSAPSADSSKCGVDGIDEWSQAAPHNVNVRFSGQTATLIQETQ